MISKKILSFCVLPIILFLSGCGPSDQEMNAKLVKGCEAAVQHILKFIDSDYSYTSLIDSDFERDRPNKMVDVVLHSNVMYREFSEEEQSFKCVFEEAKNILSYRANIDYVEAEDEKYGRVNNSLINLSIPEFSALDEVVRQATR